MSQKIWRTIRKSIAAHQAEIYYHYKFRVGPIADAYKFGRQLTCVQNNTTRIMPGNILLFCTLRNEAFRIEFFLDYYRKLGVDHFFFVDNQSTDGFMELIKDQDDCSVWYTESSYRESNFGMHWLNRLLSKYGSGYWCLTVDPDEFFVYPNCETRTLAELTSYLTSIKRDSMYSVLLDMYPNGCFKEAVCLPGQNPLEVAPYFDPDGYVSQLNKIHRNLWVRGGPRRRVIFKDNPLHAPALNKMPLIKWRKTYAYLSSMHMAAPRRLNKAHHKKLAPTACLLHFKFLASLRDKAQEELERKEHFSDSIEYHHYFQLMQREETNNFYYPRSAKYENSVQLVRLGLATPGNWF